MLTNTPKLYSHSELHQPTKPIDQKPVQAAPVSAKPCKECGAKQAQIDRLMLEYCPDEMTHEQMQEWERNIKPFVEPVKQEPVMDNERIFALREAERNGSEHNYFNARPHNDTPTLRGVFCQGFDRGFNKGLKYAAPVDAKAIREALAEQEKRGKRLNHSTPPQYPQSVSGLI